LLGAPDTDRPICGSRFVLQIPKEVAMKLRELLDQVRDLPPDTLVCAAEIDEAFATNVATAEVVEGARIESRKPNGVEAVELANGTETVIVIRW
jgi:type IV secretory pathway TrbF-like protein